MPGKYRVLIVDDEKNLRSLLSKVISLEGYDVKEVSNAKEMWKQLEIDAFHVMICDVKLPDANGVELAASIKARYPFIEIIVLTAFGTIEDGVHAIKNGAFDYLTKGDHQDKIFPLLNKACEKATLRQKVNDLENKLTNKFGFENIVGSNKILTQTTDLAKKISATDASVLILGETGVGKEVFAQAIHYESLRKTKSLVALNCSAFTKELLESELFGHAEGAFTGASKSRKGLLEEAHDGTLFLDEIGEMNIDLQTKILRVLETGEFYRVGDPKLRKVNIRLIAATNRDLEKEIEAGNFRRDLFYRLSVFVLKVPSLRERKDDIPKLATFFLKQFSLKTNKKEMTMSTGFLKALELHPWKGNIRELKNCMERCVILSDKAELTPDFLPSDFNIEEDQQSFDLASAEKRHIQKVIRYTNGNKTETARLLNIALTTLYRKLEEYNISSINLS